MAPGVPVWLRPPAGAAVPVCRSVRARGAGLPGQRGAGGRSPDRRRDRRRPVPSRRTAGQSAGERGSGQQSARSRPGPARPRRALPYLAEHLQVVLLIVQRQHLGGGEQRPPGRAGGTGRWVGVGPSPSPAAGGRRGERWPRYPALSLHPSLQARATAPPEPLPGGPQLAARRSPRPRPAPGPGPARPGGCAQCAGLEAAAGGPACAALLCRAGRKREVAAGRAAGPQLLCGGWPGGEGGGGGRSHRPQAVSWRRQARWRAASSPLWPPAGLPRGWAGRPGWG